MKIQKLNRNGTVAVLLCFLMLPMLALLALSVDYGFLLYVRTDLQRAADQATAAAVRELVPAADGTQDLDQVRETLRNYIAMNLGDSFTVLDSDIQIGRFNPATIYDSVEILDNGIFDTVSVNLRRNDLANSSVALYFARLFNTNQSDVSVRSIAVMQKARYLGPGSDILPIGVEMGVWNTLNTGDEFSIYGDGRLTDGSGHAIPGNWGTMDIGANPNSNNDLREQINNGLRQSDLDSLHSQGSIPDATHIDSQLPMTVNGDTGFSAGMKSAVDANIGRIKLIPIYGSTSGQGGNLEYGVVGWGAVEIVDTNWNGNKNSRLDVRVTYTYDSDLRPQLDLSDTTSVIRGVYTSPVLVE